MDRFEFFFTIYSLLLGFALAELMLGYANLLRAPQRPKWGWLTPALGILIFVEIIITFLDAWQKLQQVELNLLGLLTPTLVAVAFFVAAVMAVPRGATDWDSLDDYFHDRKKWILGLLAGQVGLVALVVEVPYYAGLIDSYGWRWPMTEWDFINTVFIGLHLTPIFTRNRWVCLGSLAALLALLFYYYGNYTAQPLIQAPAQSHAPAPAPASETPPGSPPPAPAR